MYKFSIILASKNLEESPFFHAIQEWPIENNIELIIIDSAYSEKIKNKLNKIKKFETLIYAPPFREPFVKAPRFSFRRDFNRALNSALILAEGKYIIRTDDYIILKNDFFQIAQEDIDQFKNKLIIGQKAHENENEERWVDYFSQRGFFPGQRFVEIDNPAITWSFGIAPLDNLIAINGWDERYDIGYGGEDADIFARYIIFAREPAILDKQLMGYGLRHARQIEDILPSKWIFEITILEIKCGKYWAYNPINLLECRKKFKDELREQFMI